MSFQEYLSKENDVAARSREEYRPEFEAFAELAGFYERLAGAVTIAEPRAIIPGELLLVVTNQMFGAGSQMLRTREVDALALTRRAIEATAAAYRIWEHPELTDVYANAYPNHAHFRHPKQWQPTGEYRREFSVAKLFDQPAGVFPALRVLYDLTSAMASHAGIGALANHRDGPRQRVAKFLGGDPRDIMNNWYTVLAAYMEMFKVFVRILRSSAPEALITILVEDFLDWCNRTAALGASRAPWAIQTAAWMRRNARIL
jgi:hypothetical protein